MKSKERTKEKREKKRKWEGSLCVCKEQDKGGGAKMVEDKKICVKRFYSLFLIH